MNDSLHRDILDSYGSFESPSWRFVEKRLRNDIYCEVIAKLREVYSLLDTTDANDDVSYCYAIDGTRLGLRLSLVGRYAVIHDSDCRIISIQGCSDSDSMMPAIKILHDQGFVLLDELTLRESISFNGGPTLLYQVLFSDDEMIV